MKKLPLYDIAKAIARGKLDSSLYLPPPKFFKRADRGLIDKVIQFGNNVPKSKHKTKRTWLPNIQSKNLYSAILGHFIKVKVTTSIQRTIDKRGGLDAYLFSEKWEDLSMKGRELRALIELKQAEKDGLLESKIEKLGIAKS